MTIKLPIVADCEGCGVCCLHMGYPTFIRPKTPLTPEQIDVDPDLRKRARNDRRRQELLAGHPGETYWERLPDELKKELEDYIEGYSAVDGALDGPCIWLDLETRRCKHHKYRPRVCRDFEVGGRGCRDWREYYRDMLSDDTAS